MKQPNQEILFKNTTKYNSKNYNQFIEFHNKKFAFSNNFYTIIMTILLIYCIILNTKKLNIPFLFLFVALLICFLLWRIYFPMKRYQKTQKKLGKIKESRYTFSFYNLYFQLDKKVIYYFKLYKVFETKDYFYLYINPDYAMLVSKDGFEIGSLDDFRKFIKKKCLLKYRKAL